MADQDMPVEEEHLDSIPWSSLVHQTRDRPWLVYVAAGAVVALVVGVLAARSLGAPVTAPVAETTPPPATIAAVPPASQPLSEADLRADLQPGEAGAEAAAMRAEWFVTDYFTRDGAGGRDAELAGALGRPIHTAASGATTYVEWARAWETVPEGDGRYRISVAYRSITAVEAVFERGLVRGVSVRVQVGAEGGTRVVDLPEPIQIPPAPLLIAPPAPELVSESISAAAMDAAASWGEPISVVEGALVGSEWKVLVEVADEHGTVWPMIISVENEEPGS